MPSHFVFINARNSFFRRVTGLFVVLLVLWAPGGAFAEKVARPLIVGGYEATPGAWPWMAGLLTAGVANNYYAQYCGGSLIRSQWVLTAAHCLVDHNGFVESPQNLNVLVGAHNLSTGEGSRVGTSTIVVHPGYNPNTLENDIALVQLAQPLGYPTVQLPGVSIDQFVFNQGRTVDLLGWGATTPDGSMAPDELRRVSLVVADQSQCSQWWWPNPITDGMICIWWQPGGKDTCVGDSGGPAVTWENGRWEQLGITSFGEASACAQSNAYGVYTRISRYADWISNTTCSAGERPTKPAVTIQVQGNHATLSIDSGNAPYHRLYYAPAPGMTPIAYVDLGGARQFSVDLPSGSDYFAAVQGYSGPCLGAVSDIYEVVVP